MVYLAESAFGAHRSQLGLQLPPERRFQQATLKREGVGVNLLGGGFKYFLFSPLFGEDSNFD